MDELGYGPYEYDLDGLARMAAKLLCDGVSHDSDDVRRLAEDLHGVVLETAAEMHARRHDAGHDGFGDTWFEKVMQLSETCWP